MTDEDDRDAHVEVDMKDHRTSTDERLSLAKLRLLAARAMNIPASLSNKDIKQLGAALLASIGQPASK